jgi:hypothetical protein
VCIRVCKTPSGQRNIHNNRAIFIRLATTSHQLRSPFLPGYLGKPDLKKGKEVI